MARPVGIVGNSKVAIELLWSYGSGWCPQTTPLALRSIIDVPNCELIVRVPIATGRPVLLVPGVGRGGYPCRAPRPAQDP